MVTEELFRTIPTTRYQGSKRKILPWIYDCIKDCAEHYNINYGTFRGYLSTYMPKKFKTLGLGYI